MPIQRKQFVAGAMALLVVIGALAIILHRQTPATREAAAVSVEAAPQHRESAATARPEPMPPAAMEQAHAVAAEPKPTPSITQPPKPTEPEGIQVGDSTWNAKTQAEADWLNTNFYPTDEEMSGPAHPDDLPADLIPRSARDLANASNVAGQRNRSERDRERAQVVLQNGVVEGYVYAFVALGMLYEQSAPLESQAYFRAASHLGDWTVSLRVRPRLPHMTDVAASLLSQQILVEADQLRAQRGLPPLGRNVRPGLDAMLDVVMLSLMQPEDDDAAP